jgi:hypothetical protein
MVERVTQTPNVKGSNPVGARENGGKKFFSGEKEEVERKALRDSLFFILDNGCDSFNDWPKDPVYVLD